MRKYALLVLLLIAFSAQFAGGQASRTKKPRPAVFKLEELTYPEIGKLDRAKTIFFITFGNLEEHGPHLPIGSDFFQAVAVRDGLIARLRAAHPDYDFVVVPVVPLGECGANILAGQAEHIGTFAVRFETLRNVAIDLGADIARKGFQNILIVHNHGCPLHNVAFTQAAGFVRDKYKVRMANLTGIVYGSGSFFSPKVLEKYLGKDWHERIGEEGHSGAAETSTNLFVRADLVKPEYRQLRPYVAKDIFDMLRASERGGWQGYWGDPSQASRALGKELIADSVEQSFRIAEKIIAGEDVSKMPVFPANLPPSPDVEKVIDWLLQSYMRDTAEIEAWLKAQQPPKP